MADRQSTKAEVTCQHCNSVFHVKASWAKDRKYCSRACLHASGRTPCDCLGCGKSFSVQKNQLDRGEGKYCSKKCFLTAITTAQARRCLRCGADFTASLRDVTEGGGKYCSVKCYRDIPVIDRFWSHVQVGAPDECWPWKLGTVGPGYGQFWNGTEHVPAHRFAYESRYGPLGDLLGCHSCDNPPCCNPDHIFPGTYLDNTHDMIQKGRDRFTGRPPKQSSQVEPI